MMQSSSRITAEYGVPRKREGAIKLTKLLWNVYVSPKNCSVTRTITGDLFSITYEKKNKVTMDSIAVTLREAVATIYVLYAF